VTGLGAAREPGQGAVHRLARGHPARLVEYQEAVNRRGWHVDGLRVAHAAQRSKRADRPLTPPRCVRGSGYYFLPVSSSASLSASYTLRSASIIPCECTARARACSSV